MHDAVAEYQAVKNKLSLGGGISGWSGLARYASPSAGTIMGIDAPIFEQATADITDQFLRKLIRFHGPVPATVGKTTANLIDDFYLQSFFRFGDVTVAV